ncbi:MAG TPA: FG-GAP-like repeat-containing protein, partial [Actinomycetes bacterium]
QWGADERLRSSPPAYSSTIKGGFVHHTDGANGYASADVPKIIRGIYAYHTKSNGWSDIGYNFLVDRFGRLWEGRYGGMDRPVIGAHTGGFNDDTFGISAIGNYDTAAAPSAMVTSIARLMAWKLSLHYRNPNGTMTLTSTGGGTSRYSAGTVVTKPAISGHRDMGYTACPGRYLYSYMSTIRSKAVAYLAVGLVNPSVSVTTTSARVRSGVLKSAQSWAVTLKNAATGVQISRVTGTGSVDTTRPLTDAKGQPLPDGRYTLTVDSWYGTTTARPYVSTIILGTPGAVTHDMNGDKRGDVVARVASTGDLRIYFGSGAGGFNGATTVAPAWNGMSVIEGVGDFDGDQLADVVAVENETGSLFLYPGNGAGGFGERRQIGHNWGGLRLITGIGDFNSDDTMDLVGVTADGSLLLYQGDGKGGFKGSSVAGRGWSGFDKLVGMGDVDGDGHPDLLGRVSAQARLAFYRGDGTGRFFSGNTLTGTGWNAMSELMSPGDFDGDRHPDLLAIERATGTLWLYHGSGTTLPSRRAAGSGWSGIDILG